MAIILATWEAELGKITVKVQPGHETPSQPRKTGHGVTSMSSSYVGSINRRTTKQTTCSNVRDITQKLPKQKELGT
jgi:hypothetical protein